MTSKPLILHADTANDSVYTQITPGGTGMNTFIDKSYSVASSSAITASSVWNADYAPNIFVSLPAGVWELNVKVNWVQNSSNWSNIQIGLFDSNVQAPVSTVVGNWTQNDVSSSIVNFTQAIHNWRFVSSGSLDGSCMISFYAKATWSGGTAPNYQYYMYYKKVA